MSEINQVRFVYPSTDRMGIEIKPEWWSSVYKICAVALLAYLSLNGIWTLSSWVVRNLCKNLIPRVLVYGAVHDSEKIVHIFSRYVSKENFNEIVNKLIEQKDAKALIRLLKSADKRSETWNVVDNELFRKILEVGDPSFFTQLLEAGVKPSEGIEKVPESYFRHIIKQDNPELTYRLHKVCAKMLYDPQFSCNIIQQFWLLSMDNFDSESVSAWVFRHVSFVMEKDGGYGLLLSNKISVANIFARIQRKAQSNINDLVSPWKLPLICFAAIENHIDLAENLIVRGATLGKCFDKNTSSYRYPYEFAAEKSYFEMADILVPDNSEIDPPSLDFLKKVLDAGSLKLLIKLIKASRPNVDIFKDPIFGFQFFSELNKQDSSLTKDEFKVIIDKILSHNEINKFLDFTLTNNRFDVLDFFIKCNVPIDIPYILQGRSNKPISDEQSIKRLEILYFLSQKTGYVDNERLEPDLQLPIKLELFDFLTSPEQLALLQKTGILKLPVCKDGITLMHWAAYLGNDGAMRDLIKANTPVDAKIERTQLTSLHLAVLRGHLECVRMLIKYPSLIRCRAITEQTIYGPIEETALETALRSGVAKMIEAFLNSQIEKSELIESLYNFFRMLDGVNVTTYNYYSDQLVNLLIKHQPFENSVDALKGECAFFLQTGYVTSMFIDALASHRPYLKYIQKFSKNVTFTHWIPSIISNTLRRNDFEPCIKRYQRDLIVEFQETPEKKKEEVLRFKEALMALQGMFKIYEIKNPPSFKENIDEMDGLLNQNSEHDFKQEFDDKMGMSIVEDIFPEKKNSEHLPYCQAAASCGLDEGRDFRLIGIDNNLSSLCDLIDKSKDKSLLRGQIDNEISKKSEFITRFHKNNFLGDVSLIEKTAPLRDIRKWERELNRLLFLWLSSNQEKVKKILGNKTALSELKEVDLVATLLGSD